MNLEQLREINAAVVRRLLIESQRLAIETRAVAAAEARVTQEARRLVMDEARILALAGSETHKWTGVATGYFEIIAVFVQRSGLDDAVAIQSGAACADDANRMRLDSKVEAGQSVLLRSPIVTENEAPRYTSAISERIIVLGCTGRF